MKGYEITRFSAHGELRQSQEIVKYSYIKKYDELKKLAGTEPTVQQVLGPIITLELE